MENENPNVAPQETGQSPPNVADGLGAVLSNPELMAKLPQIMAMLRPMMEQQTAAPPPQSGNEGAETPATASPIAPLKKTTDNRSALLPKSRSCPRIVGTPLTQCYGFPRSATFCVGCKL